MAKDNPPLDQYAFAMIANRGPWTHIGIWQCRSASKDQAEGFAMDRCLEDFPIGQFAEHQVIVLKMEKNDL